MCWPKKNEDNGLNSLFFLFRSSLYLFYFLIKTWFYSSLYYDYFFYSFIFSYFVLIFEKNDVINTRLNYHSKLLIDTPYSRYCRIIYVHPDINMLDEESIFQNPVTWSLFWVMIVSDEYDRGSF